MIIDYLRSINTGYVQTKPSNLSDKIDIFFWYFNHVGFYLGVLLGLPIYQFFKSVKVGKYDLTAVVGLTIMFVLGLYLFFCIKHMKRLICIKGGDTENNRKLISTILTSYFNGLTLHWDGNNLIASKPYNHFTMKSPWGLEIVAIFNNDEIFLNILSMYRFGPNPWLTFTNTDRAKEIGRLLKDKL